MRKILIPTDFSETADIAYNSVVNLFPKEEIEVHALSVVSVSPDILFNESGELLNDGVVDFSGLFDQQIEYKEDMEKWLIGKSMIKRSTVKLGRISNDIIQYIKDNAIDLLVMGTRGAKGVREILSGSHTSYVAMRSPVPVLSVKRDLSGKSISRIVIVGDFQNPQMVPLTFIKDLVLENQAELHLLKVNTPGDFEINIDVYNRMQEFSELNELEKVKCHLYNDNSVERGISSFCNSMKMDIIAIGSQQRTGFSRIVKKSISYDAINHLERPVITFPIN